jgi:hypothetical protein
MLSVVGSKYGITINLSLTMKCPDNAVAVELVNSLSLIKAFVNFVSPTVNGILDEDIQGYSVYSAIAYFLPNV